MKRKTLTIISIVSIIIISLILFGVTYGYFLTTIEGNESSKSVEVVTGDSKVLYTDLSTENISEIIEPGFKTVKSFTVKNTGDVTATYSIYLVDVMNSFNRTQDITYNLYKKVGTITDVTVKTELSETNGWIRVNTIENVTFPTEMSVIAPNEIIETPNQIYTYVLKVEYIDHPTENQNEDQGKTFAFKVNLRALDTYTNPFSEGSLAYNVINNVKDGTLSNKSTFIPNLNAIGMVDNGTTENDKILSTAEDDWGTTYYFRGNVVDNYVEYAGMCWRIVRIQGDGSTKLILASELSCDESKLTDDSGYITDGVRGEKGIILNGHYCYNSAVVNDYINSPEENEISSRTLLNSWLNRKISEEEQQLLKNEKWCIGDLTNAYSYDKTGKIIGKIDELIDKDESFYYTAGNKQYVIKKPSYICETYGKDEEVDINKIGMLSFDEIVYAGGTFGMPNSNYYLNNNAITKHWWSISPFEYTGGFGTDAYVVYTPNGGIEGSGVDYSYYAIRASVTLKPGVKITDGKGIVGDPYIIG